MNGACAAAAILPSERRRLISTRRNDRSGSRRRYSHRARRRAVHIIFVKRLEQRALIPLRIRIQPEVPVQLGLGDVHDAQLERRVRLGIVDEIMKASPGALYLLELLGVDDLVDLRRKLLVEPGDHLVDRVENVLLDEAGICQRLLDQGADGVLDLRRRPLASGPEALFQQTREFIRIHNRRSSRCALALDFSRHCHHP